MTETIVKANILLDFDFWTNNPKPAKVENLIKQGTNIEATDEDGTTVLMYASWFNKNIQVIKILIDNGADINVKDNDGWNALMYASEHNQNPEIIKLLEKCGAK